ncbi:MAG: c-type cytochrome [Bacteroidota bacterium]
MKTKLVFFNLAALVIIVALTTAFSAGKEPWVIPAKYKAMKNTVKSNADNIKVGKALWDKQCKSCHGGAGKGDGVKAKGLKTSCGDMAAAAFQAQTDGEIYFQSFIGRNEMPNFEKKIADETDRWSVVNYIRSLK